MTKKRILFAVTTFNQADYTARCLESLAGNECDVVVFDDCSTDHTADICSRYGVQFVRRIFPRGLTHSYNLAFRRFLRCKYDQLVVANNDVLVPAGTVEIVSSHLDHLPYVGVLTRPGDRTVFRSHNIANYHKLPPDVDPDNSDHYQMVADAIRKANSSALRVPCLYGFFFGVSRKIERYAFAGGFLFDPRLKNTRQEYDLASRTGGGHVCLDAFVYHHKGVSTGVTDVRCEQFKETRNDLRRYHRAASRILIGNGLRKHAAFVARSRRWVDQNFRQRYG